MHKAFASEMPTDSCSIGGEFESPLRALVYTYSSYLHLDTEQPQSDLIFWNSFLIQTFQEGLYFFMDPFFN
jgi:hypothetical protein